MRSGRGSSTVEVFWVDCVRHPGLVYPCMCVLYYAPITVWIVLCIASATTTRTRNRRTPVRDIPLGCRQPSMRMHVRCVSRRVSRCNLTHPRPQLTQHATVRRSQSPPYHSFGTQLRVSEQTRWGGFEPTALRVSRLSGRSVSMQMHDYDVRRCCAEAHVHYVFR